MPLSRGKTINKADWAITQMLKLSVRGFIIFMTTVWCVKGYSGEGEEHTWSTWGISTKEGNY